MLRTVITIVTTAILCACASSHDRLPFENRSLDRLTSTQLETFGSTAEFNRYVDRVQRIAKAEHKRLYSARPVLYAQMQAETSGATDECLDGECLEDETSRLQQSVTVTASKRSSNPSITNNQKAGVEEGDIVKQIDDFLIVLQDGRLFSINIKPDGRDGLRLTDRKNVYWNADSDTWYDEMLVSGRRIVVTGYSYDADASEVSILTLNEDGIFTHEDTFYIASDDYYDTENYATRVVGDKFIVHTPLYMFGYNPEDALPWPVIHHWGSDFEVADFDAWEDLPSSRLLSPRNIYRPVQNTLAPVVHVITICDIGGHRTGKMLDCDTTAFVAPEGYEFFVSETDVYVWTWPDEDEWGLRYSSRQDGACDTAGRVERKAALPAMVFRVPIRGGLPEILGTKGRPFDQFSLDSQRGVFRALVDWTDPACANSSEYFHPTFFSIATSRFSSSVSAGFSGVYTELPDFSSDSSLENRFTDHHLVYAVSDDWGYYPPDADEVQDAARLTVVPVDQPERLISLDAPHSVIRLERLANDAVITGYTDDTGLRVSVLSLNDPVAIASTALLPSRFESEGRSHAFNAIANPDESALMGIPTVLKPTDAGRWWWNSESSDVSFLSMDPARHLRDVGALLASESNEHDSYQCDVSCVDWYGNSRPIFTDGRVFALSGTELVEGIFVDGSIRELRRANLTEPTKPMF